MEFAPRLMIVVILNVQKQTRGLVVKIIMTTRPLSAFKRAMIKKKVYDLGIGKGALDASKCNKITCCASL
jgi:hypothetical protein